jgi:hypothetical protein
MPSHQRTPWSSLEDQTSAQRMAEGVKAAIPSASLRIVRVLAEA